MRRTDPSWHIFRQAINSAKPAKLAADLAIEARTVSEWKARRRLPELADLPRISAALADGDATYLARRMGIVPDEHVSVDEFTSAYLELSRLRAEVEAHRARLRTPPNDVTARVVEATLRSERWAVSIWPAFEGPPGCRLHVADRLDFIRTDGGPDDAQLFEHELGAQLDLLGVVRSTANIMPRFPHGFKDDSVRAWSVQKFVADRPPVERPADLSNRTIAVISSSVHAWPSDVAAAIARTLGYGLASTRAVATAMNGGMRSGESAMRWRDAVHRQFFTAPRHNYVWYHFGHVGKPEDLVPDVRDWPVGLKMIRLRESDRLIDTAAEREMKPHLRAAHRRDRDLLDRWCRRIPDTLLKTFDIDNPIDEDGSPLERSIERNIKLTRLLELSRESLRWIEPRLLTEPAMLDGVGGVEQDAERDKLVAWLRS